MIYNNTISVLYNVQCSVTVTVTWVCVVCSRGLGRVDDVCPRDWPRQQWMNWSVAWLDACLLAVMASWSILARVLVCWPVILPPLTVLPGCPARQRFPRAGRCWLGGARVANVVGLPTTYTVLALAHCQRSVARHWNMHQRWHTGVWDEMRCWFCDRS